MTCLYKVVRQKRERGDGAPLPHGGGTPAKLTAEHWHQVAQWIEATPDVTLAELQSPVTEKRQVRVGRRTIGRGARRWG